MRASQCQNPHNFILKNIIVWIQITKRQSQKRVFNYIWPLNNAFYRVTNSISPVKSLFAHPFMWWICVHLYVRQVLKPIRLGQNLLFALCVSKFWEYNEVWTVWGCKKLGVGKAVCLRCTFTQRVCKLTDFPNQYLLSRHNKSKLWSFLHF